MPLTRETGLPRPRIGPCKLCATRVKTSPFLWKRPGTSGFSEVAWSCGRALQGSTAGRGSRAILDPWETSAGVLLGPLFRGRSGFRLFFKRWVSGLILRRHNCSSLRTAYKNVTTTVSLYFLDIYRSGVDLRWICSPLFGGRATDRNAYRKTLFGGNGDNAVIREVDSYEIV